MNPAQGTRVAVIGAGISGIAAAVMLQQNGYEVVVFEKSGAIGGVWALAYPEVRLQNLANHYHLADFPWPFTPDRHPSGAQIRRYLDAAVAHFRLDLRLSHAVLALEERAEGWLVRYAGPEGVVEALFGYVVVAVGQYTEGKVRPVFPGQADFRGEILTEREVRSLDSFADRRVAVVGFGKSAVDMATFAARRGRQVFHIFRTPRWLVPEQILGLHFTYALFNRFGTVMMPSWDHPSAAERFLHRQLSPLVAGFWGVVSAILGFQIRRHGAPADRAAQARLALVQPEHALAPDLRSAAALAPEHYYAHVAAGRIEPRRAEVVGLCAEGLCLAQGELIACDSVVIAYGSQTPRFPFLPAAYRQLLEADADGAQLYRHLIHPRIPRMGFAGFNHGFMHVPAVEVATLWLCALWRGELELPALEAMEQSMARVQAWKRAHIHFEPARACAVSTRFQQYLDTLLQDLGLSPYRKLPNPLAEVFGRYGAADYRGVLAEYRRGQARRTAPLRPLPVDM